MTPKTTARRCAVAAVAALPLAALAVAALPGSAAAAGNDTSEKLRAAVTSDGLFAHLREFQRIADANGGNRASGTAGYDQSADYVAGRAAAAGYDVTRQSFLFDFFDETAPAVLQRTAPSAATYETSTMTFSGSGDVTAAVTPVDLKLAEADRAGSTSGCEAADFSGFPTGSIALLQRGTCTFEVKAANAQAAGAAAVILFNQGNTPTRVALLEGTLGRPFTLPVVGTSFATGQELAASGTSARVFTATTNEKRRTVNVIAESGTGDAAKTVVLGAHLDSVDDSPAINDNGTGSAALLEIAIQARDIAPTNKLRFVWFGAEELGLLGSEHYVAQLTAAQRSAIELYLNVDMIGSPNFVRFVFDGDDSVGDDNAGPSGSAQIEKGLLDYFASQNLPTEPVDLSGSSDYAPFADAGIPVGGVFAGADGVKTEEQARVYGGTAGQAYDPNYHTPRERIETVNATIFEQNADAIADAVIRYAFAADPVTPAPAASPSASPSATATATISPRPSSTSTAPPAACAPTSVQLERTTITATGSTGVTIRTAPNSIVDLYAYTQPSRTFRVVRSAEVNSTGSVPDIRISPPANTRLYAQQRGCPVDAARDSVVVNVRTAISLQVTRTGPRAYTFSGDSLPARAGGLIVSLYRVTSSGSQVLTAQTRADASTGEYRIERRFSGGGRFGFVVRTGQDAQNAPGSSNVRSVLVF